MAKTKQPTKLERFLKDALRGKLIAPFTQEMVECLVNPKQWQAWTPSDVELTLLCGSLLEQIKRAGAIGNSKLAKEKSAELSLVAMKCFYQFGKENKE